MLAVTHTDTFNWVIYIDDLQKRSQKKHINLALPEWGELKDVGGDEFCAGRVGMLDIESGMSAEKSCSVAIWCLVLSPWECTDIEGTSADCPTDSAAGESLILLSVHCGLSMLPLWLLLGCGSLETSELRSVKVRVRRSSVRRRVMFSCQPSCLENPLAAPVLDTIRASSWGRGHAWRLQVIHRRRSKLRSHK